MKEKTKLTKFYYKNGQKKKEDQEKSEAKAAYCTEQILKTKNNCILSVINNLDNPNTAPKTYWSKLNRSLCSNKIPTVSPLLINSNFVAHFSTKDNLFNDLLPSLCTSINNESSLLLFAYKTNSKITSFRVTQNDISLIIKTLDPEKAHGCDNIPIKMTQICDESIAFPLELKFETALREKNSQIF